jgi:[acyl-carrier-protein] S-malonyltransferase
MKTNKKIAFIFPGQGAQYIGMGHDFFRQFARARQVYEEADDLLKRKLTDVIFQSSEKELTETKNSQPAIFVTSLALLAVIEELFPHLTPFATAGLSLGEYSALVASKKISFQEACPLVQARGQFMHDACEAIPGAMSVILGLDDEAVEEIVRSYNSPEEVSCANFNCPGQVVISGTKKGIEEASALLSSKGAKKIIPLPVHGAFHSHLMKSAQEKLQPYLNTAHFLESDILLATNVTGTFATSTSEIKELLIRQVTSPVRWQKAVSTIDLAGCELFVEIGCGKTLAAMNKRIGVKAPTITIEKVEDLKTLEQCKD